MTFLYKSLTLTALILALSACTTDPSINNYQNQVNNVEHSPIVQKSEKSQVLNTVQNFATSVACSTSFDNDIVQKTATDDVFLVGDSEYLVYWSGDIGCSGGIADNTSFMTSVNRVSDTKPLLVDTDFGEEKIHHNKFFHNLDIYPRFVSDIDYNEGIFSIISSHDNNDSENGWVGANSPRYKYRYIVSKDELGNWKVVNKMLLADYKADVKPY